MDPLRSNAITRRTFVAASVGTAAVATSATALATTFGGADEPSKDRAASGGARRGRLKQSVCRWCYGGMPLDELCRNAKSMGLASVELLGETEWPATKAAGLTCAVANGPTTIQRGFNRVEHHDEFVKASERLLPLVAEAGIPAMIVFSGNRAGLSDSEGMRNCIAGLKRMAPIAERCGVTVIMELLNSKVDHKDYQCDRTPWGVEVVKGVGSPRIKLLYDIYHMQIMEGDVIRTITDHAEHIAHYHTGGVPGRREIDGAQELNYAAICTAIVDKGYTGFLGQEFIPARDPMTSLREAVAICDV
ncbi:MAG: TIM barrel protein [Phycisphaerales bacterium]